MPPFQGLHTIFFGYFLVDDGIGSSAVIFQVHADALEQLHVEAEVPCLGTFPFQIRVGQTVYGSIILIISREQSTIRGYQLGADAIYHVSLYSVGGAQVQLIHPAHFVFEEFFLAYLP